MCDSMIEIVARAHYTRLIEWAAEHAPGAPFMTWGELPTEQRNGQLAACRAAITAMREPTDGMKLAGGMAVYRGDNFDAKCAKEDALSVWAPMIAAALAEDGAEVNKV